MFIQVFGSFVLGYLFLTKLEALFIYSVYESAVENKELEYVFPTLWFVSSIFLLVTFDE